MVVFNTAFYQFVEVLFSYITIASGQMFQQISRIDKEKYDNDHEEALADIDHEYRGVWGEMHKIFFGIYFSTKCMRYFSVSKKDFQYWQHCMYQIIYGEAMKILFKDTQ